MVKISGEKFNKFLLPQDRFSSLTMLLYYPCISGSFNLVISTPSPFGRSISRLPRRSIVPFDSVIPTPSPSGPTFDCSLTCIVPDAEPLWGQLSVALPSVFPNFRFSRPPWCSIVVSNHFVINDFANLPPLLLSCKFDSLVPTPSPFGPPFGRSMTCIVPDAAPLWGQLSVALPSAFASFRFSRLPRRSIVCFVVKPLCGDSSPGRTISPVRGTPHPKSPALPPFAFR